MYHPLLAVLFYGLYFIVGVLIGSFVLGPMMRHIPAQKLRRLILIWLLAIALGTIAQHYGQRYLEDGRPESQVRMALMPCFFLVMLVTALVRRTRSRNR